MIGGMGEYRLKLKWDNNRIYIVVTNKLLRVYVVCNCDDSVDGDYACDIYLRV